MTDRHLIFIVIVLAALFIAGIVLVERFDHADDREPQERGMRI